jgi:hypothetical protein
LVDSSAKRTYGSYANAGGIDADSIDLDLLRNSRIFERAIVIETLCDPSNRLEEPPENLKEEHKDLYRIAPRNSLICRVLTTDNSKSTNNDIVCFPFFSSHIAMPVKSGEQVWIFNEVLFDDTFSGRGYWISRVSDILPLEDANITAFSRTIFSALEKEESVNRTLGFDNDTAAGQYIAGNNDEIKNVILNAEERSSSQFEPVPRLTKRPGDLVLQGSNNATIILGSDRGFDFSKRPNQDKNSNAKENFDKKSGTVDIVSGRGRYFEAESTLADKSRNNQEAAGIKNSTQPFVAKNSLENFESDKNPEETQQRSALKENGVSTGEPGNLKTNPVEGDPDFLVDASRIYVSEKSDIDKKLGLDQIKAKGFAAQFESVSPAPCVAVKSDHVRIVARKVPLKAVDGKLPDGFNEANGTIRIVKEGKPDEDLACIYIEADGTIQISGKQIYLGRQKDDGGAGNGPADGEAQPYIKYKELEELWTNTMDELNKFCDSLLTHVTPGYGSPSPQINKAAQDLKAAIESNLKSDIETVKSERIFGE